MAAKLIPLEEAAQMLGLDADKLSEMRSEGEIHGYRDGSSWKFKLTEIERVADELGVTLGPGGDIDSIADLQDSEATFDGELDDLIDVGGEAVDELGGSSILVSDDASGPAGSSIIGGEDIELAGDSDLQLAPGSGIGLSEDDSDVALAADEGGSDVRLVAGDSDAGDLVTDSDVLASDSGGQATGTSDTGRLLDSNDELDLEDDALELATGDSLALGDDELLLEEESGIGKGSKVAIDDDDDELVLTGSGIGSDVTLGTGDSGIGLGNPSESGLDLEEPAFDLGGSSVEALELPEDDDDVIALEEEADPDAATQLKADDEFLLTPVEDDDDDDESGSQVIALEDSAAYDADAATMLGSDQAVMQEALVADDADMFGQQLDAYNQQGAAPAGAAQPMPMQMPMHATMELPEAPYSIWNVMALMFVMMFMLVTALLMVDVVNNMWGFEGVSSHSTSIMDTIVSALGLDS